MLALPLAYASVVAAGAWRSGLTWREMDLDRDGSTSLTEVWFVSDYGVRAVTVGGQRCEEVFLLKDGSPLKVRCPAG